MVFICGFESLFWRLFWLFCSRVWAVRWFSPLHIIVRSSANKNSLTGFRDRFVITSFMAMKNRLTLRTDPCGTLFSMVLERDSLRFWLGWSLYGKSFWWNWRCFWFRASVGFLKFSISIPYRMPFRCQDIQQLNVISWQRLPASRFLGWLSYHK